MLKHIAMLAAALALVGCGIPEYFDQHHANVREASDDESDNNGAPQNTAVAKAQPPAVAPQQPQAVATPAPVAAVALANPSPAPPQESSAPTTVPSPPMAAVAQAEPPVTVPQQAPPAVPATEVLVAAPPPPADSPPASPPTSELPAQPSIAAYCEALAKQRANDAAINGNDDDTQQAVHDGTYKSCVTWQTAHGDPN